MANPETLVESTTVTGSVAVASTGNITLISSGTNQIYVYAYTIAGPVSASSGGLSVRLMSGSTTPCWTAALTATSTTLGGVDRLAVAPPSYLFRTVAGDPLTYEKGGSSVAGQLTSFSFGFWRQ